MPDLPPAIERVVLKALAKKPEERFASVRAFAEALEQAAKKPAPGTTPFTCEHPGDSVFTVTWSPDETRIASGGNDAMVRVWDMASSKQLLTLRGHQTQF